MHSEAGRWTNRFSIKGPPCLLRSESGFGGGLKVGLFPHFTKRMIGLEIDSNGHGGAISFPNSANGQNGGTGRSNLVVLNTTVNLILRYPGEAGPA